MKKNLLIILLSLAIIIPLTSAAGIGSFLDTIDQSTLVLGCLFVIFFALANFSLGKFFKDRKTGQPNKGITSVVSFCVSLLMIYGINKSNFDYSGAVGSLGLPNDVLIIVLAVLLTAGLVYMLIKLKTKALLYTGLFLIFLAYFAEALNVEFDKGKLLVTGGIILILWLLALVWTKRKNWGNSKKKDNLNEANSSEKDAERASDAAKRAAEAAIHATNAEEARRAAEAAKKAAQESAREAQEAKVATEALIQNAKQNPSPQANQQANQSAKSAAEAEQEAKNAMYYAAIAIKAANQKTQQAITDPKKLLETREVQDARRRKEGIPILIGAAQKWRQISDAQPNPKKFRTWAYFIHYLTKEKKYGSSEKEICWKFGVSIQEIQKVVKDYIL